MLYKTHVELRSWRQKFSFHGREIIREDMNLINGIRYSNIHTFAFEFSKFLMP